MLLHIDFASFPRALAGIQSLWNTDRYPGSSKLLSHHRPLVFLVWALRNPSPWVGPLLCGSRPCAYHWRDSTPICPLNSGSEHLNNTPCCSASVHWSVAGGKVLWSTTLYTQHKYNTEAHLGVRSGFLDIAWTRRRAEASRQHCQSARPVLAPDPGSTITFPANSSNCGVGQWKAQVASSLILFLLSWLNCAPASWECSLFPEKKERKKKSAEFFSPTTWRVYTHFKCVTSSFDTSTYSWSWKTSLPGS